MKSVNVNEVWKVGIPCDLGMGANARDCFLGAAVYDNGDLIFIILILHSYTIITILILHNIDRIVSCDMCAGQCNEHLGVIVPSQDKLLMPNNLTNVNSCKTYLVLSFE